MNGKSYMGIFDWYIYISIWPILKVKVKSHTISTKNILEMARDVEKINIVTK